MSLVALLAGVAGCHLMVNPFTDELAAQQAVTTPSVEGARTVAATPAHLSRPHERIEVHAQNGAVTHGPLYFEDGFEDRTDGDGLFAWTGEDYLQPLYWRGRFMLNAALFPVSVAFTPPHVVMESDGRISRKVLGISHDAAR